MNRSDGGGVKRDKGKGIAEPGDSAESLNYYPDPEGHQNDGDDE